ncbi:hypothetical protein AVEN_60703-1 [Araneus ventricosus]|uniref:Uncharacterized protein n=1 Tax=Araneus ventricosus TaxID=182803 RepID=A0A4Y2VFE6_ARAVE|nr:hypothetical protein AVEN_60703-1 [Araneus ventricosus]
MKKGPSNTEATLRFHSLRRIRTRTLVPTAEQWCSRKIAAPGRSKSSTGTLDNENRAVLWTFSQFISRKKSTTRTPFRLHYYSRKKPLSYHKK